MDNSSNSPQDNTVLKLYPMTIPGLITEVLPAGKYHGGISRTLYSETTPLAMVIDPYLVRNALAVGDSVVLWVNDEETSAIKIIKSGEENQPIDMKLPWGWMIDGLNTLFYRVKRVSGNYEDSTPVLNLLFHTPVTGITVSHPGSIDATQSATFTITRSYPREYDNMTLTIGRWRKTIADIHQTNPITYTLTPAERQEIGEGSHTVSATIVDQLKNISVSPTSSIVLKKEWEDHYTSLAVEEEFNGWIRYTGARSGRIRPHFMNNQWVTAFFNFTDQGPATGFAGAVLYRDFVCIPGQYRFTFEGTHIADSPGPGLVNPILCADTGMAQWPGDRRIVPKNGIWYLFLNAFTLTQKQTVRLYVSNFQDGSNGNDFGIRNIRVERVSTDGGIMSASASESESELQIYEGPVPKFDYPD
ncbi:hypothetical protein ACXR0M_12590 [Pseudomonas sp. Eth.TT006]